MVPDETERADQMEVHGARIAAGQLVDERADLVGQRHVGIQESNRRLVGV